MKNNILILLGFTITLLFACKTEPRTVEPPTEQTEAQAFLDTYNLEYVRLAYASSLAEWKTNTEIKEGDTLNAYNSRIADEALTAFTGSVENIEKTRKFLAQK